MLYHLFDYLQQNYNLPGAGVFQYISFRAAMAVIISLVISLLFGKSLIEKLRNLQAAETIRTLGLDGEEAKKGTPTMGGLIILAAILIPTILFAKLNNVYVLLMIFSTIWLGVIGFIDDYIKIFSGFNFELFYKIIAPELVKYVIAFDLDVIFFTITHCFYTNLC